jgi:O-antigen/teichoic acid export membrane protein
LVLFLNEAFISLWLGSDKFAGYGVMVWLILYMVVNIAMATFGIIIYSSKKFESWTFWSIVEIIVAISLSYLLSFYYGLLGIIAGFVLASFITQVYLFSIVLKQVDMQKGIFLNVVLKYAIPPNIIPLCFGFLIFYKYKIDTWLEFVAFGIVFVALSFIIDFFKMYRSNETTLKNKFLKVMLS